MNKSLTSNSNLTWLSLVEDDLLRGEGACRCRPSPLSLICTSSVTVAGVMIGWLEVTATAYTCVYSDVRVEDAVLAAVP